MFRSDWNAFIASLIDCSIKNNFDFWRQIAQNLSSSVQKRHKIGALVCYSVNIDIHASITQVRRMNFASATAYLKVRIKKILN